MSQFDYKEYYSRNRPHIAPPDSVFFVTFRLAGSIPKATLQKYRSEKAWYDFQIDRLKKSASNGRHLEDILTFHRKWFAEFERITDKAKDGPVWLGIPEIREIAADRIISGDPTDYVLNAYSIMSNHIHVVFKPNVSVRNLSESLKDSKPHFSSTQKTLGQIMQSIKGGIARAANIELKRTGKFWEHESYDHFVRNEQELNRIIKYTINNPVKANLVSHWSEWPGNFLAPDLKDKFE